jgi:UPF0271 protein
MKININADCGESFGRYVLGNDSERLPLIGSANIACGMHAGDPLTMATTVDMAMKCGISIGAHPGFDDRWGFGRRRIDLEPNQLEHLVLYQIGALQAIAAAKGAKVTHVKPHGALNNMAIVDGEYAKAIGRAIRSADPTLTFVANVGSAMHRAAETLGLRVAREFYADRAYDDDGNILSRKSPNAMIRDAETAAAQIMRAVEDGHVISVTGRKINVTVDSICIHGDEPTAVDVARAVRGALTSAG